MLGLEVIISVFVMRFVRVKAATTPPALEIKENLAVWALCDSMYFHTVFVKAGLHFLINLCDCTSCRYEIRTWRGGSLVCLTVGEGLGGGGPSVPIFLGGQFGVIKIMGTE
jgi:hypothetical protein